MKKLDLTQSQKELIVELYSQGKSFRQIERETSISRHIISDFVQNDVSHVLQINPINNKVAIKSIQPEDINNEAEDLVNFYFKKLNKVPENNISLKAYEHIKKLLYNGYYYDQLRAAIMFFIYDKNIISSIDKVELISQKRLKIIELDSSHINDKEWNMRINQQIENEINKELESQDLKNDITYLTSKYIESHKNDILEWEVYIFEEKKEGTIANIIREYIINLPTIINFEFENIPKYTLTLRTMQKYLKLDFIALKQVVIGLARNNININDVYSAIHQVLNEFTKFSK